MCSMEGRHNFRSPVNTTRGVEATFGAPKVQQGRNSEAHRTCRGAGALAFALPLVVPPGHLCFTRKRAVGRGGQDTEAARRNEGVHLPAQVVALEESFFHNATAAELRHNRCADAVCPKAEGDAGRGAASCALRRELRALEEARCTTIFVVLPGQDGRACCCSAAAACLCGRERWSRADRANRCARGGRSPCALEELRKGLPTGSGDHPQA
mmetsp:Transcript_26249/g.61209  ORF Transcript_26249/g.61209 Transcript_26249/m.61209 type:complete len:211 (-) Transcript_26249:465-1097(-)